MINVKPSKATSYPTVCTMLLTFTWRVCQRMLTRHYQTSFILRSTATEVNCCAVNCICADTMIRIYNRNWIDNSIDIETPICKQTIHSTGSKKLSSERGNITSINTIHRHTRPRYQYQRNSTEAEIKRAAKQQTTAPAVGCAHYSDR